MEKLNNLTPLNSSNEELYISKEVKKENALASEGKSCRPEKINMRVTTFQYELYFNKPPKFTFAQSKRFPPKHNLLDRENNKTIHWSKQRFLHEVKVACFLPFPLF